MVGFIGLLQPFRNAIKLFFKEADLSFNVKFFVVLFFSSDRIFLFLMVWLIFPFIRIVLNFNLGILYFLCVPSLGVYGIMISGWSLIQIMLYWVGLRAVV